MSSYLEKKLQNKKRILYLVGGFHVGGTERHLSQILPELSEDFDVIVVCLGQDGPLSKKIKEKGILIHFLTQRPLLNIPKIAGVSLLIRNILTVLFLLRKYKPVAIHSFLGAPTIVAGVVSRFFPKIKFIASKRNQLSRPDSFWKEGVFEKWALKKANLVLAHSTEVQRELIEIGVSSKNTLLIHNGIRGSNFLRNLSVRNAYREQHSWDEAVTFTLVANLIPYKGHEFALRAAADLKTKNLPQRWKLVFVGKGDQEYTNQLLSFVTDLELENCVDFLGYQSNIEQILQASDVGMLLSKHEGFSNSILEYMASSLPVIATNVGGNKDSVIPNETGYLVEQNDTEKLTSYMSELILNTDRRLQLGSIAKEKVETDFSLTGMFAKYRDMYDMVLNNSPDRDSGNAR